ncbi:MAG: ABC transporter permease [Propionibacteriaceae bacterium]|nr:ABC transporter permease [Propionibacteriaceae bacterium]
MSDSSSKTAEQFRVYEPHKAGLPKMGEYFSELWRRREFAIELSHTNMRATNTNTVLGQLWLVVNPLLLAGVYFLLVVVLSGGKNADGFPQIASGLFLFFYVTGSMTACATSVTNAGGLILNMNFPKMLLIFSNVYMGFRRFLPTLAVYFVIHIIWRIPWTWQMLWLPVIIFLATLLAIGLGSLVATWHVYFRDTAQFLPYFIRIWLYCSPVLYTAEQFFGGPLGRVGQWIQFNPVFSLLGIWSDVWHGLPMNWAYLGIATAWAVVMLFVGSLYFMSRERDFAVRL